MRTPVSEQSLIELKCWSDPPADMTFCSSRLFHVNFCSMLGALNSNLACFIWLVVKSRNIKCKTNSVPVIENKNINITMNFLTWFNLTYLLQLFIHILDFVIVQTEWQVLFFSLYGINLLNKTEMNFICLNQKFKYLVDFKMQTEISIFT